MVASSTSATQRDVWLADFGEPVGSNPGFVRPVVIVQNDRLNATRLHTYLCIPMTGSLKHAAAPWNLALSPEATGLPHESLAQANLLTTVDETQLGDRIGSIGVSDLQRLFACLDVALGRT